MGTLSKQWIQILKIVLNVSTNDKPLIFNGLTFFHPRSNFFLTAVNFFEVTIHTLSPFKMT